MNHANIRERDEDVTILCKSPTLPTIEIYEVDPVTYLMANITPVGATPINTIEDYYKYTLHTPNKNCFLYVKFGLNGFILRVRTPRYVYFLIALDFLEGIVLSYRQIAFDGTVTRTGALNEAGRGLYYLEIHDGINDSFIEIVYSNTIRPYSSVSSKLVKYELVYADHYMRLKNTPYNISVKKMSNHLCDSSLRLIRCA